MRARQELETLLITTLHLTQKHRELKRPPNCKDLQERLDIQTKLDLWLKRVEETRAQLLALASCKDDFAYQLLCLYHTVTIVMTDVSIYADPECHYDLHTPAFISILRQASSLFKNAPTHNTSHEPPDSTDAKSI